MTEDTKSKIAVIADIHSNFHGLNAVVADAEACGVNRYWCLGDIVGRGPNPIKTANLIEGIYWGCSPEDRKGWIAGNHDYLVSGRIPPEIFDIPADKASASNNKRKSLSGMSLAAIIMAQDNREKLDLDLRQNFIEWLHNMDPYAEPRPGIYLAHGVYKLNGNGPQADFDYAYREYSWPDEKVIRPQIEQLTTHRPNRPRIVMVGHTHLSMLWLYDETGCEPIKDHRSKIHEFPKLDHQTIFLNPGSVGFPAGPDKTASYSDVVYPESCASYVILTLDQADPYWASIEFRSVSCDWLALRQDALLVPDFPPDIMGEIMRLIEEGCTHS